MNIAQQEFAKFSADALNEMKTFSDETHKSHEWMSYVYDVNGTYELGEPSYGSESKITIDPATKLAEDNSKFGYTEAQRKWTIHGHPLKDGDIYNGRQFFSSTDIIQEFIDARDNDTYIVQFLVHPHQQVDKATGETVIHNRVRTLVFPGRDAVVAAMKKSNPTIDPYSITVENGTNQNTGGGLTNEIGVDWFALDGAASFQKSMEDAGYVSVMDLEGPAATTKASERIGQSTLRTTATYAVPIAILGIIVALANKSRQSDADDS
jgi:hypothetical protein